MGFFDSLRRLVRGKPGNAAQRLAPDTAFSGVYGSGGGGGFAGGAVGRLTASLATWSGSVNTDLDASLSIMRARGRELAQSNEYGKRFLSLVASNIVGPHGPTLQVRAYMAGPDPVNGRPVLDKAANDAIEVHWQRWARNADITGRMDLAHVCRVAARAVARDGEALIRKVRQPKLPYGMALQVLECDRLDDQLNTMLANGNSIRQGVEIDTTGRPVAYHLRSYHPGDRVNVARTEYERVPADQIIHLFLPERAEQVRGYTWFHAVILRASRLHAFNEAAVIAAQIGASKVAAIQSRPEDPPAPNTLEQYSDARVPGTAQSGGALHMNVEAGEMFELPPGYELQSWDPEYPHANYSAFVQTALRGIAMGVDVAAHNLGGDLSDVNYSSARIGELVERELWKTLQQWFIRGLVRPVFDDWLAMALLRKDITFPTSGKALPADKLQKFLDAAMFRGRRWSWVDPAKEIEAAERAVALGITTRTRLAAEQGDDFDDILDELAQEEEAIRRAGFDPARFSGKPAAAPPKPAPAPADA